VKIIAERSVPDPLADARRAKRGVVSTAMHQRRLGVALSLFMVPFVLSSLACGGSEEEGESEPNPLRREMRELTLLSPPAESNQPSMFSTPGPSIRALIDALEEVRTDEHVVALFVRLGPMGGSYGSIDDVAEALQAVRDAGKPVHCHFEVIDNTGYALAASACDRITVTPAGMLDVVGVAAQVFYARTLLENMGVVADVVHMGRFKDAAEPLVADEMGPETRESLGGLVDDLHQRLIDAMVSGRSMTAEAAQAAIDAGPQDSATALALHLVDAVEFDDEARTHCREAASATRNVTLRLTPETEPLGIGGLLDVLGGSPPPIHPDGPRIVLAYLDGQITDAEEAGGGGTAQAGPFVEGMREIAEDEDVVAMVLRINSPGGSALASDRMWHAVRRVAERIPVIVSVGDMAASGGYYIAVAGDEIFAHDASIVGSIGVVGGKVSLDPLLDRIGVTPVVISRGRHATWSTLTQLWTEEERAVVERLMGSTYERFISRVVAGRELDWNAVAAVAEGRVWSGRDGLEHGLIDHIGGLRAAIARARELASAGDEVPIEEWPRERSVIEVIAQSFGGGNASVRREGVGEFLALPEAAQRTLELGEMFSREHVVVSMPFLLTIR
jgi:protease-4